MENAARDAPGGNCGKTEGRRFDSAGVPFYALSKAPRGAVKKKGFIGSLSPINKILISFLLLIMAGTMLLMLPPATNDGIGFVDALFTSTSAVCVTGLVVKDTEKDFTFLGQLVILLLIQFGGLGMMTFSVGLFSFLSGDISIKWKFTLESFYNDLGRMPIRSLLVKIMKYTFVIEFVAALLLFTQFVRYKPIAAAAWDALFHSVSAFCNAGFSTYSTSMVGFRENAVVLTVISLNIVLGGLGFLVLTEISRARLGSGIRKCFAHFTLHTRFVLVLTGILIAFGMVSFAALEWNNALKDFAPADIVTNSLLQSISCRTAGFNSVDIGGLRESTLLMMIFLMFIGGSPGSIAGGVKTTTMGVIMLLLYTRLRGRQQIVIWKRALDENTIEKSMLLFVLALIFVIAASFFLMTIEPMEVKNLFLSLLFEVTSAFGTVGLSTGITPALSNAARLTLCLVMYAGRLGPLTLVAALTGAKKEIDISHPQEHIMIG